jgi:hypothetical protein
MFYFIARLGRPGLSLGAAFIKIAFAFKGFKFFLYSGTPPEILFLFPTPPFSNFKLSLFFARAYNFILPGLFCTTFHACRSCRIADMTPPEPEALRG